MTLIILLSCKQFGYLIIDIWYEMHFVTFFEIRQVRGHFADKVYALQFFNFEVFTLDLFLSTRFGFRVSMFALSRKLRATPLFNKSISSLFLYL